MPVDGERFEIIAMDDLGREIELPCLVETPTLKSNASSIFNLMIEAYGNQFLSKKQRVWLGMEKVECGKSGAMCYTGK